MKEPVRGSVSVSVNSDCILKTCDYVGFNVGYSLCEYYWDLDKKKSLV